jgi:NAD(P)-dependent dehydrogenase (short-subunit alcohol dehydrogenase family)
MMKGLQGKTAIVTGGTRGIGRAVAEMLLENGVSVLITGRRQSVGEETLQELSAAYETRVVFFCGDMGKEQTCIDVADEALLQFGRVDFLVNNAFPFTARTTYQATRADWLSVMETGPIAYATMIAQYARVHGREVPGAIVNMSSISQYIAQEFRTTYNVAKGAVGQLTKAAALELCPHIRVNSVSPGCVWTDITGCDHDDPFIQRLQLIGRIIEPEEVAAAVCFLLSDWASAITGTDLMVDGGYRAMGAECRCNGREETLLDNN